MIHYTVDRRKRRGEFCWMVLRNGMFVTAVATYLQAYRISILLNKSAVMTEEQIVALHLATRGESYR